MSPRFSFLLALKQGPAGLVPSQEQQLTEGRARLSVGSKLLLRWALYVWAGRRAHLGMLTLQPHKGRNCLQPCQGTGNLHAFSLRMQGFNPKVNHFGLGQQTFYMYIQILDQIQTKHAFLIDFKSVHAYRKDQ